MKLINLDAVVAEIEKRIKEINSANIEDWRYRLQREHDIEIIKNIISLINTLEVKDVDVNKISESLAEAEEYLDYTHTSNLVHNKPMIVARLRSAIKELNNAKLFQLTHDVKYRMECLGIKAQKGE